MSVNDSNGNPIGIGATVLFSAVVIDVQNEEQKIVVDIEGVPATLSGSVTTIIDNPARAGTASSQKAIDDATARARKTT